MNKKNLLSKLKLQTTPMREQMVTLLLDNKSIGFSEIEINQIFNPSLNRISIRRTIRTLAEKSVIHRIVCENGVLKYAHNATQNATAMQPHFECTGCGKVLCLGEKGVSRIYLSKDYLPKETHLLVKGLCPHCAPDKKP